MISDKLKLTSGVQLPDIGSTTEVNLLNDKEIEKQNRLKGIAAIKNLENMEEELKKAGLIECQVPEKLDKFYRQIRNSLDAIFSGILIGRFLF